MKLFAIGPVVCALVSASFCSISQAQLSELYLNQHDNGPGNVYVVRGGVIVRQWAAQRGSLFVSGATVRTAGNTGGSGAEYTLAGIPTGITFPAPGTVGMHDDDSTTDGAFVYGLDYLSQNIVRFNLDWSSPTDLFPVADDSAGVTWDSIDNTFWTMGWTTTTVNHYSSTGTHLGSFNVDRSGNVGIAIDPADHTLWFTHWDSNQIEQYSVTGVHLQTLAVAGLATDIAGAEFAISAPSATTLAFGLEHEPLNGANLSFDVDGNLVVTPGGGPGAGDEDVSVHLSDGSGLSFAPSPTSDLSQLGQRLRSTMRGTVDDVPDTVVAVSTIAGTGTSALLSVDFPLGAAEGQRARLYDDRNRLIACIVIPNGSAFTLTSPTRTASVTKSSSNIKNNLTAPQPEHTDVFSSDLDVTHPSAPGEPWHKVRKISVQSLKKQGDPIRSVNINLGKKPAGSGLVIQQEAADVPLPGAPKGSASFATTGQAVITPITDAVILTEPPGGGTGVFEIADRGLPGEMRRGKQRAEVEMEPVPVGPLAEGSYLKTTAHLLIKGKLCPPECYEVGVTEKKVAGPLPVEIDADFTALGSTTHRVTVLLDGVVLGVHTGVGPVIGYAEEFATARDVAPATPITRGPNSPVKGISVGLVKKPTGPVQIAGAPYTADEIRIEPEYPILSIQAFDVCGLQTQGLGSITVTSATFEDSALLVGGLPVSLAGTEAELDLDTKDQVVVAAIGCCLGGTGQDGYTVDLGAAASGYIADLPCLICGGIQEARYDLDVTTDTVSLVIQWTSEDHVTFEPTTPGGTYDIRAYKKGLKVYSADHRTGPALVLTGGTKPVPMELFIEEIEGTTYVVQALSLGDGSGTPSIGGTGQDGVDYIEIVCPVTPGAVVKKLDCRLTTDRPEAVYRTDQALLGPGRLPIAGLGEAEFEVIGGQLTATGLTDTGKDGVAIKEKGAQVAGAQWLPPEVTAPAGSWVTITGSFAGALDPTTTFAATKKDTRRPDGFFDVFADFTAIGSSTVHVEVMSGGVLVAEMSGHGPDVGIVGSAPIGAGAGAALGDTWAFDGIGVSSSYPAGTSFIIDGQTYSGDQLVLGAEGRAATQQLMGLSVTTVGYERLVFGEFSFEPIPVCLADLNDDTLVDFADYLVFLNFYDAQDLHVDFNQDGMVDFSDYLEFLNLYDAGC